MHVSDIGKTCGVTDRGVGRIVKVVHLVVTVDFGGTVGVFHEKYVWLMDEDALAKEIAIELKSGWTVNQRLVSALNINVKPYL